MYNTDTKSLVKQKEKTLKKNILRYNEYYNIQSTFDNLYKQSKEGSSFKHLFEIISSRENILLAYRTIKRNKGSKTAGTNRHNIKTWEIKDVEEYITYIQNRLNNYIPQPVRRVEIPKPNGKTRPLGIPCIEDRLIQQCIKQVLEPICEAKFFEHSYGFRPNRSTEHAIAYAVKKTNIDKCYYVVDVDIKCFFDNVNHGKLLKQLWTIGIHDKKLLSIISAMLKAEIKGEGVPTKGVPQGGILSPLLANVVLNELDWWIATQWQHFETTHCFNNTSHKYRHMRSSSLKEIYLVRYADDFKIYCKEQEDAVKIFHATQQWLKERLSLEISQEKSQIVDIRKKSSDFLGFKLKAYKKNHKWIILSHMTNKAQKSAKQSLQKQIRYIQKNSCTFTVQNLNKIIVGLQNYYSIATEVIEDFRNIYFKLLKCLENRLKQVRTKQGYKPKEYLKRYKKCNEKIIYVANTVIYPIVYIQTKPPKLCNQNVNNYTKEGRKIIHSDLKGLNRELMNYLLNNPISDNIELNDNRLSLYSAQKGKCAVTNKMLQEDLEVHHIVPKSQGGTDEYKNLTLISKDIHTLIHATRIETILYYMNILRLSKKALNKLNKYRLNIGNEMIMSE